MPQNWKTYKLGDVATLQRGFDLPNSKREAGPYPVIAASGFSTWHKEFKVEGPGVTTGRSGTLGQVFYEEKNFWPLNTSLWVKNFHGNDPKFIYYFLKTLNFDEFNTGTSVPTLNRNHVHGLNVQVPPLQEQKAIASILSAIDDKIENNLAMNKTLEEMAMALYKHWFVDFGPFQHQEFIDSELGSIPKGWRITSILDTNLFITDYVSNGSFKSLKENVNLYDDREEFALFVRNTDLKTDFSKDLKYVDEPSYNFLSKSKLFGNEIIISNVGDVGSVYLCPSFSRPMTLGNNVIMLKAHAYTNYLYRFFLSAYGQHLLRGITGGSAQPKFNKTDFKSLNILWPEQRDIEKANEQLTPIQDKIFQNKEENHYLAKLRDTLLPKLISGEVRVKDAEQTVTNAL